MSEFEDLFTGLGWVPGVHHIQTKPEVMPLIHPPRTVPLALKKDTEENWNIWKRWGSSKNRLSMVTIRKGLHTLSRSKQENTILSKHFRKFLQKMPRAKIFSVVDANQGFWQIWLDDESSKLCKFNSPFGRYSFSRLPFGILSAPEASQRCLSQHLERMWGVVNVMDDIVVWEKTKTRMTADWESGKKNWEAHTWNGTKKKWELFLRCQRGKVQYSKVHPNLHCTCF